MKLPREKQREIEKKGKPKQKPVPGGGAKGRLRQFERERGLEGTDLENPATDEAAEKKKKGQRSRDRG